MVLLLFDAGGRFGTSGRGHVDAEAAVRTVVGMLITSHVAAASLLTRRMRSPGAASVVGAASHLALDMLPHWGTSDRRLFIRVARIDGLVGLVLLTHLLRTGSAAQRAALVAAVIPDIDKPALHFLGARILPTHVASWLAAIQDEAPHRLTREVAVAGVLAAAAALAARRREGGRQDG